MAFDGTKNDARLNREILIRELRENPPEWWNFHSCETCAMEVGARIGAHVRLSKVFGRYRPSVLRRTYGLCRTDVMKVFYLNHGSGKTPAEVADELEAAPFVSV